MRAWPAELAAILATPGVQPHLALWLEPVDVADQVARPLGWWTGGYRLSLELDGKARTFEPVGDSLSMELLEPDVSIESRLYRISMLASGADFAAATKGLDLAFAPVRLWRLVADPADRWRWHAVRLLKGWLHEIEARAGTPRQAGGVEITVATSADALTWPLEDRRFNEATLSRRSRSEGGELAFLTASQTWAIPAVSGIVIEAVGGGGGPSDAQTMAPGQDGGATVVTLRDGGVDQKTWTFAGGAGGAGVVFKSQEPTAPAAPAADVTPLSPYGDGLAGTCEAESGAQDTWRCSVPGAAGRYLRIELPDLSGYVAPELVVTIGTGPGGDGAVRVAELGQGADAFFRHGAIAGEVQRPW